MLRANLARTDRFLDYLENRIKVKRAEYVHPDTSERGRDILETEIAELKAICRAYKEQFLEACTEPH